MYFCRVFSRPLFTNLKSHNKNMKCVSLLSSEKSNKVQAHHGRKQRTLFLRTLLNLLLQKRIDPCFVGFCGNNQMNPPFYPFQAPKLDNNNFQQHFKAFGVYQMNYIQSCWRWPPSSTICWHPSQNSFRRPIRGLSKCSSSISTHSEFVEKLPGVLSDSHTQQSMSVSQEDLNRNGNTMRVIVKLGSLDMDTDAGAQFHSAGKQKGIHPSIYTKIT